MGRILPLAAQVRSDGHAISALWLRAARALLLLPVGALLGAARFVRLCVAAAAAERMAPAIRRDASVRVSPVAHAGEETPVWLLRVLP